MIDLAEARGELAERALQARQARAASLLADPASLDRLAAEAGLPAALEAIDDAQALQAEQAREAATLAEAARRQSLTSRLWQAAAGRIAAIERAEAALAALVAALAEAEGGRQTIAALASALPVQLPSPLAPEETALTASRYIAAALARVGSPARFGSLQFPAGLLADGSTSWSAVERGVAERFTSSITRIASK